MTKLIIAIVFSFTICYHLGLAQVSSFFEDAQILRVGQFHKSEVNPESGGVWFGLFPTQSGYELKRTTVAIQSAHDVVVDPDLTVKTGWGVTINSNTEPIVLMRGIKNLKEGEVKTSFFGMSTLLSGKPLILKLTESRESYGLSPNSKNEKIQGGTLYTDYSLKLWFGQKTQIIATFNRLADDGMPSIVWAGDLDRDGKLDLLLDLTNHYNISQYTLFLSSVAKPSELVKKVADFRIGGC